jgi:hypothetical protein
LPSPAPVAATPCERAARRHLIIDKIEAIAGTDTTLTSQLSSDVLTKGTFSRIAGSSR